MSKTLNRAIFFAIGVTAFVPMAWSQAIDKNAVVTANQPAMVKVQAFGTAADGTVRAADVGTGVFVSSDGYILTALHVVGRDDEWQKLGPDQLPNRHVEVTVLNKLGVPYVISESAAVKAIPGSDLALLRVSGSCFTYASISKERPRGYPTLVVISWGEATTPHATSTDLTNTDIEKYGDKLTIEKISPVGGYSGSPLFDSTGSIVGILTEKLGGFAPLAVPSTDAIPYLPAQVNGPDAQKYSLECYAICRHPDNGIENWAHQVSWAADSGWRGGGGDPTSFCAAEKVKREQANPGHVVTFQTQPEDHQAIYNPFKHDEYRYRCIGTEQWDPIFREARSPSCGLPAAGEGACAHTKGNDNLPRGS